MRAAGSGAFGPVWSAKRRTAWFGSSASCIVSQTKTGATFTPASTIRPSSFPGTVNSWPKRSGLTPPERTQRSELPMPGRRSVNINEPLATWPALSISC